VEVVRFEAGEAARLRLRRLLIENERSACDFVIINFLQSVATGDPAGAVGHVAPVGAYDAAKNRILLFDPDRQWYEPYWISEETLLAAMATKDPVSGRARGWVQVTVGHTPPQPGP
jgi:hypothetical protein